MTYLDLGIADGNYQVSTLQAFLAKLVVAYVENEKNVPEIEGVANTLLLLKYNNISLATFNDLWIYATFITYIFDYRFTSLIEKSTNQLLSAGSAIYTNGYPNWNITQAANYTLSSLSGACLDYTRLYDITLSIFYPSETQLMCIVSPVGFEGHAMPVFSYNNQWYLYDYTKLVKLDDPVGAWKYFIDTYYNGISIPADVSFSKVIPYDPAQTQSTFGQCIVYTTGDKINSSGISKNNSVVYDALYSPNWNTVSQQTWKLFQISSFNNLANNYSAVFWILIAVIILVLLRF